MTQTYNAAVIQLTIPTRLVKSFMSHTWLDRSQVASQVNQHVISNLLLLSQLFVTRNNIKRLK